MHTEQRILITGAGGRMGLALRPRLAREGRTLRLTDRFRLDPAADGEAVEEVVADLTDLEAMTAAAADCDAIIHLGGQSTESDWADVLDANVNGSHQVLEAARRSGVRRVIVASSHHAAGMYERADAPESGLPADVPARPDTYYGFSTAAKELLGRLYAERYGMDVIVLRIGTFSARPEAERTLGTWLSPDDSARLVETCLSAPAGGYRVIWGISANTRSWWSSAEGSALGYRPLDNAETYAADVPPATPTEIADMRRVGGALTRLPIGRTPDYSLPDAPPERFAPKPEEPR